MHVDLFSVTAPLQIRTPDGEKRIIAEAFPHPEGLLFFEPFWHLQEDGAGTFLVTGELSGSGPWKCGKAVISVMGCRNTDPDVASDYALWRDYLQMQADEYPAREFVLARARTLGAAV